MNSNPLFPPVNFRQAHLVVVSSLLALLLFFPTPLIAEDSWSGKVVKVADGDTITVLHNGRGERVRLYGIDTPEKGQDFWRRAKAFTADRVAGKVVTVVPLDVDRYGRTVGLVYPGGEGQSVSVNEELVANGLAWVFLRYCHEGFCGSWTELEGKAQQAQIGLWALPDPVSPWDFRGGRKG
jgi:endonuclease YncB( thermonuclease family)